MLHKKQIILKLILSYLSSRPKISYLLLVALSMTLGLFCFPVVTQACVQAQTCSTNFEVNEAFFGNGGDLNDCSANYCSKLAAGETGVGNITSPNYQANAGFNTDRSP